MDLDDKERAKAAVWAKELAIYGARSKGDLHFYASQTADGYLAWPPQKPHPIDASGLSADARLLEGNSLEKLAMTLTDFSLNGDTAIVYYTTHRTALPDGSAIDQRFQNIHVWVWRDGDWQILGGMARRSTAE